MSSMNDVNIDENELKTILEQINAEDARNGFKLDVMQEETEKEIIKIKKRLAKEYQQALKELEKQWNAYYKRYEAEDKKKAKQVKQGVITKDEHREWRQKELLAHGDLKKQVDQMSQYLANADQQAADIVNGKRYQVYANNYNYGRYEIEKGLEIDTKFTLFDQRTVEKLVKDNPKLLPSIKPDKIKGQKWSKRKINNVITQGVLQGKPLPEIAKGFSTVVGMDWNSAVRNARTAMTGAQNSGRMQSYKDATKIGINLKKEWMATLDERTRTSHGKLDGKSVDIDEKFDNGLMFPADPEGKPAEVYNCRCTLVADLIDYPKQDFQRYDNIAGVPIDNISYSEWAAAKKQANSASTFGEKILSIKNDPTLSEAEKIRRAGKVMADELNSEYLDSMAKEQAWLKQERMDLIKSGRSSRIDSKRFTEYSNRDIKFAKLNNYENHSQMLFNKLSQIREMGFTDDSAIKSHLHNSRSPVRKYIEWAYKHYPTDWVKDSLAGSMLTPKKVDRGYYSHWLGEIGISVWGNEMQPYATAVHELGHRFEKVRGGILQAEKDFYGYRTKGEALQWLGAGYSRSEKTRKDKFIDTYMGKDYAGTAYELVSMGFEYAYTNPLALYKDREMQEWIYGLLCIL